MNMSNKKSPEEDSAYQKSISTSFLEDKTL